MQSGREPRAQGNSDSDWPHLPRLIAASRPAAGCEAHGVRERRAPRDRRSLVGYAFDLSTTCALKSNWITSVGFRPGIPSSPAVAVSGGPVQVMVGSLCMPFPLPLA